MFESEKDFVEDEAVASLCENMLRDDSLLKSIRGVGKDGRPFIQRVIDLFDRIIDALTKRDARNTQGVDPSARLVFDVKKVRTQWVAALDELRGSEKTNNANAEARFSSKDSFSKQIDNVLNGSHNPRYDLYVSETTEELQKLGFPAAPMLMRNSKAAEILDKHSEMSIDDIKQIPNAIANPVLILKSKTHPAESVVIITEVHTKKGDMVIPVWVNQDGNYCDVVVGDVNRNANFVASAYGRSVKALIEYAAKHDGFLFRSVETEKVGQLFARNGLQLPTPLKLSNSDIIVSPSAAAVNTHSIQNSQNDAQSYREKSHEEDIRFSLRRTQKMSWEDQMNEYFSPNHGGLKSSDSLYLGKSGDTYSGFGMDNHGIGMSLGTVNKVMRTSVGSKSGHSLSEQNIRSLHEGIIHPLAIVDNANRNCVYVITGEVDMNGYPLIAAVQKNANVDFYPAHMVTSIYGMRDAISNFREHIPRNSRIEVFNKTKLAELLLGRGVQYAKLGTILNEFASVILSDRESTVNPSLKNNFRAKSRLPSGENPVREVSVPSETTADDGETRRVRRFVRTVLESDKITDEMVAPIAEEVLQGGRFRRLGC